MKLNKRLFVTASCAALALALTACASMPEPASITDTAARTPQLSTLTKLVTDAGLADTLRGAGPYTVFAPSDEAFKKLPAKTLSDLASNKEMLRAVLTYHVVPGKVMAVDVKDCKAKTVNGAEISVARAGTFVTVEDAVVQTADVVASNGVVHIIDTVLIPPRR